MTARLHKVLALVALLAMCSVGQALAQYSSLVIEVAASAGKTSPAVYGFDVRVAPGFAVGDGDVTVHPTAGYSRSLGGGVDGETDDIMHLGAQVRAPVSESGLWLGGEAAYARRWTGFDSPSIETDTTNGWTLTALAGLPLGDGGFGAYAAAGVNKYGGTGFYARLGFELSR